MASDMCRVYGLLGQSDRPRRYRSRMKISLSLKTQLLPSDGNLMNHDVDDVNRKLEASILYVPPSLCHQARIHEKATLFKEAY